MNEQLQERLGSILSDPQQMQKIQALAQSLMGSEPDAEPAEAPAPEAGGLAALLGTGNAGQGQSESEKLLRAMQPYMRPKRREKIDRALRLTKLIGFAGRMMEQYGDGL